MKQSQKKNQSKANSQENKFDQVIQYCDDIISGKIIACEQIKNQVKRFYNDLETDYYVDLNSFEHCINFFELIRHYTGKTQGQTFKPLQWQQFVIQNLVQLKHKETNLPKYTEQYLQLPRKQGKSFLAQQLQMYYMVQNGEMGAEVIVSQNNTNQAQIIYNMAYRISRQLDPQDEYFRHLRGKKISFEHLYQSLQVIAQQSKQLDGLNASFAIVDEYHQASNSTQYDAIKTSMGFRQSPLLVTITTQGFNLDGVCYQYYKRQKDVVSGVIDEKNLFVQIYEQDNIEEIVDPDMWIKSNVSLNQTVNKQFLDEQYQKYLLYPHEQTNVLTKSFNMWCQSKEEAMFQDQMVIDCMIDKVEFDINHLVYVGIDLASTGDLTQVSYLQKYDDGTYQTKVDYYYPKYNLKQNDLTQYLVEWNRQGFIKFTESNVTDYNIILEDIMKYTNKNFVIHSVIYDRWNQTQFQINLEQEGYTTKAYSQTTGSMSIPTNELIRQILSKKIKIEKNPVLLWNFRNCITYRDKMYEENIKPIKASPNQKIDGVHAILNQIAGTQLS